MNPYGIVYVVCGVRIRNYGQRIRRCIYRVFRISYLIIIIIICWLYGWPYKIFITDVVLLFGHPARPDWGPKGLAWMEGLNFLLLLLFCFLSAFATIARTNTEGPRVTAVGIVVSYTYVAVVAY